MQKNSPQMGNLKDEISLFEIVHKLIASKKLIITITLLITILSSIYSYQKAPVYKSFALIEIGRYGQHKQTLIEPAPSLIRDLMINFAHKQNELINITSFEDKLIRIHTELTSSVKSEKLINEIIEYIENRHTYLQKSNAHQAKNYLSNIITNKILTINNALPQIDLKIKSLNAIINIDEANLKILKSNFVLFQQRLAQPPTPDQVIYSYKNQLLDLNNQHKSLQQEKVNLQLQLKLLEGNNLEYFEIFKLLPEKDSLEELFFNELHLESLLHQKYTNSRLIGEIQTNALNPKHKTNILFSFILGIFFSSFIVFINEFVKTIRKDYAQ
jgi:hypothetical protein